MATHIFRVTVRGRFDGLTDEVRSQLSARADEHDGLTARFDATGTLVYDKAIDAAFGGARARAVALLDSLGAGYRDLKVDGTDMADVWR